MLDHWQPFPNVLLAKPVAKSFRSDDLSKDRIEQIEITGTQILMQMKCNKHSSLLPSELFGLTNGSDSSAIGSAEQE
jgi:hypothetical protein